MTCLATHELDNNNKTKEKEPKEEESGKDVTLTSESHIDSNQGDLYNSKITCNMHSVNASITFMCIDVLSLHVDEVDSKNESAENKEVTQD